MVQNYLLIKFLAATWIRLPHTLALARRSLLVRLKSIVRILVRMMVLILVQSINQSIKRDSILLLSLMVPLHQMGLMREDSSRNTGCWGIINYQLLMNYVLVLGHLN